MTNLRQAATLALEALTYCEALNRDVEQQKTQAVTALRKALEQPEQEPVALRELLISAAALAVTAERKGEYKGAFWAADAILEILSQQPEQEPIGWLDGDETLAEFMHRDLKAAHDRCGSTTPREFTIPVYLVPPAMVEQEPTCLECKAAVLYECVACSSNNYPPKPEQRPWVGLTEGERNDLEDYLKRTIGKSEFDAIEAKLKEKNT